MRAGNCGNKENNEQSRVILLTIFARPRQDKTARKLKSSVAGVNRI